jgi:hypothetical protein
MDVRLSETASFPAPPEAVWAALTDLDNMPLFSGYGPIPGIAEARWIDGSSFRAGAVREIRNRDGSTHREDVAAAVAPTLLEDRIHGFTSPLRFLVREARDRFVLTAEQRGNGTRLERTFTLELRSAVVAPLAALLLPLLRRAIRRHHAALAVRLASNPLA